MPPQSNTSFGQVGVDRLVGGAVALRDDGLEQAEEADRGDDPDDRRRAPQRAEHERLERERHRAGGDHRDDERRERRPLALVLEVDERDVRREGADRPLREVDQARAAVDEHRALREQRVGGPRAEPDDQELQERLHASSGPAGQAGVGDPARQFTRSAGLRGTEGRTAEHLVEADLRALDEVALEPVGRLGLGIPPVGGPVVGARPLVDARGG